MAIPEKFHPSTAVLMKLLDMRGGCTCFISPPCRACAEPITDDEFDELLEAFPEELAPPPVDFSAITRGFCQ